MKITTFRVPIVLERKGKGVELTILEDDKKIASERELEEGSENIIKLTKQISDFNEMQKTVVKGTLLKNEESREGFIQMQILT